MTCREKLEIEHPECVDDWTEGGCIGCPHRYGYLPKLSEEECEKMDCDECWDREIPEAESAKSYCWLCYLKNSTVILNFDFQCHYVHLNDGMAYFKNNANEQAVLAIVPIENILYIIKRGE